METEHFQVHFRVITLGSIKIKNNQIEKELTAWLFSKLHIIRKLQVQTEDDNTDWAFSRIKL